MNNHPFLTGSAPVAVMSPDNPAFPEALHPAYRNQDTFSAMGQELAQMGYKFEATHGKYGSPERSYIVYGIPKDAAVQLGQRFGQESVVHGENGKHQMIYTNGPKAGTYNPSLPKVDVSPTEPPDNFTYINGLGHVTLHFDWMKHHPLEHPEQSMPGTQGNEENTMANDNKEVGAAEVRKALIETLKGALAKNEVAGREEVRLALLGVVKAQLDEHLSALVEMRKSEESSPAYSHSPKEESSPAEEASHEDKMDRAGLCKNCGKSGHSLDKCMEKAEGLIKGASYADRADVGLDTNKGRWVVQNDDGSGYEFFTPRPHGALSPEAAAKPEGERPLWTPEYRHAHQIPKGHVPTPVKGAPITHFDGTGNVLATLPSPNSVDHAMQMIDEHRAKNGKQAKRGGSIEKAEDLDKSKGTGPKGGPGWRTEKPAHRTFSPNTTGGRNPEDIRRAKATGGLDAKSPSYGKNMQQRTEDKNKAARERAKNYYHHRQLEANAAKKGSGDIEKAEEMKTSPENKKAKLPGSKIKDLSPKKGGSGDLHKAGPPMAKPPTAPSTPAAPPQSKPAGIKKAEEMEKGVHNVKAEEGMGKKPRNTILGAGMSAQGKAADTEESDSQYIAQKQARAKAKAAENMEKAAIPGTIRGDAQQAAHAASKAVTPAIPGGRPSPSGAKNIRLPALQNDPGLELDTSKKTFAPGVSAKPPVTAGGFAAAPKVVAPMGNAVGSPGAHPATARPGIFGLLAAKDFKKNEQN